MLTSIPLGYWCHFGSATFGPNDAASFMEFRKFRAGATLLVLVANGGSLRRKVAGDVLHCVTNSQFMKRYTQGQNTSKMNTRGERERKRDQERERKREWGREQELDRQREQGRKTRTWMRTWTKTPGRKREWERDEWEQRRERERCVMLWYSSATWKEHLKEVAGRILPATS